MPILDSAEITHASLRMMTVYELEKPIGAAATHKRCRANLDQAFGQVEQLLRSRWGGAVAVEDEKGLQHVD